MMLIDEFMPEFDFREIHDIHIRAGRPEVFRALHETDLADSWIIRTLLFMRGMRGSGVKLSDLEKTHFEMLGEIEDEEILIGVVGKFWKLTGNLYETDAESFKEFDKEGFAKAVWNFSLEENGDETHLRTETRIRCTDEQSRKKFGFYWTFVQPFSGLIRTVMLKAVKRRIVR